MGIHSGLGCAGALEHLRTSISAIGEEPPGFGIHETHCNPHEAL